MCFHHYLTTFTASYNICVAIYIIVMYLSAVQAKIKALQFAFIAPSHNGLFPRIFSLALCDRCVSRLKSPQNNNFSQIVMNENFNSILYDFYTYFKTNFCKLNV